MYRIYLGWLPSQPSHLKHNGNEAIATDTRNSGGLCNPPTACWTSDLKIERRCRGPQQVCLHRRRVSRCEMRRIRGHAPHGACRPAARHSRSGCKRPQRPALTAKPTAKRANQGSPERTSADASALKFRICGSSRTPSNRFPLFRKQPGVEVGLLLGSPAHISVPPKRDVVPKAAAPQLC